MSSHHFVKEDQEPALLILDPHAIAFEKIQELLEWSPTVIVSESILNNVLGWGIKIDVVVCIDSNLESLKSLLIDQAPLKFISARQSTEFLAMAIDYSIAANYNSLNILASDPSTLDFCQTVAGVMVEVFFNNAKWTFIRSCHFEKWAAKGIHFLTYPTSVHGNFNVVGLDSQWRSTHDGKIIVSSSVPFWIGEVL